MVEGVLGRLGPATLPVSDACAARLAEMADRRAAGEPLQYVLGSWAFRTLELGVDPRALIPRPETEQVTEVALAEARRVRAGLAGRPGQPLVLADLGTGTGAIALSLAVELTAELPGRPGQPAEHCGALEVWATDVDPAALALATANRHRVGAAHPGAAERVRLRLGWWFAALPAGLRGRLHAVVANPPYVGEEEWKALDPGVRREPRVALVAADGSDGTPGLAAVEAVVSGARSWLAPEGSVVVELAPSQAGPAARLAERLGYRAVRVVPDLAGRPRTLVGRR